MQRILIIVTHENEHRRRGRKARSWSEANEHDHSGHQIMGCHEQVMRPNSALQRSINGRLPGLLPPAKLKR